MTSDEKGWPILFVYCIYSCREVALLMRSFVRELLSIFIVLGFVQGCSRGPLKVLVDLIIDIFNNRDLIQVLTTKKSEQGQKKLQYTGLMSSLFIKHNSKHAQKKTIGSIICLKKPKNHYGLSKTTVQIENYSMECSNKKLEKPIKTWTFNESLV